MSEYTLTVNEPVELPRAPRVPLPEGKPSAGPEPAYFWRAKG